MDNSKKTEDFYQKLKAQLQDTALWPSAYLYKFIVVSNDKKVEDLKALFNNLNADITTKPSRNGKYTSISINVIMKNPDAVIERYMAVSDTIEGVISL